MHTISLDTIGLKDRDNPTTWSEGSFTEDLYLEFREKAVGERGAEEGVIGACLTFQSVHVLHFDRGTSSLPCGNELRHHYQSLRP